MGLIVGCFWVELVCCCKSLFGPEKWVSKWALGLIENKGETITTKIKTRDNIDQ